MTAVTVTCPGCGRSLTVSDAAPMRLTCPRCLTKIDRPASTSATANKPMHVLPLDEQARRDSKLGSTALVPLGAVVAIGLFLALSSANLPFLGAIVAVLVLVAAVLLAIAQTANREIKKTPPGPRTSYPLPPPMPQGTGPNVIDYRRPRPGGGRGHPGSSLGAFAAGFFVSIGVCAACFFLLAATAGSGNSGQSLHSLYLALVVIVVITNAVLGGTIGGRWPGFGAGTAAGMGLGMLALAPCGLCYLMTL
jgi:hypothetical protein